MKKVENSPQATRALRALPPPKAPPVLASSGSPMTATGHALPPFQACLGKALEAPETKTETNLPMKTGVVVGKAKGKALGKARSHSSPSALLLGVCLSTPKVRHGVDPGEMHRVGARNPGLLDGSEPFEVELPWPSRSGNRSVRHGGGSHYLSREALTYRKAVRRALEARRLADRGWLGPYQLELVLAPPDGRQRDGDNVEKVLMDAVVRAGLLADDSNRVIRRVTREWTEPESPGRILIIGKVV